MGQSAPFELGKVVECARRVPTLSAARSFIVRLRCLRRARSLTPSSGVNANVERLCFMLASSRGLNQQRLMAGRPAFKFIRQHFNGLDAEPITPTPA